MKNKANKKIIFGNYKGGVGKTTSTFYLAKQFADNIFDENKKVLIIDLDPQCSMSEICMKSYNSNIQDEYILEDIETLNYVLDVLAMSKKYNTTVKFDFSKIIKNCKKLSSNVDFIPISLLYSRKNADFNGFDGLIDELQKNQDHNILLLNEIFNLIEQEYDYDFIFFDCPPSNNLITKSAFLLADYYIIPYISDNISVKGVQHYIQTVNSVYNKYCEQHSDSYFYKAIFKNKPNLLGIFECMRVRNTNPRGDLSIIEAKKYDTVIHELVSISEKLSTGNTDETVDTYKKLAIEIMQDIYNIIN